MTVSSLLLSLDAPAKDYIATPRTGAFPPTAGIAGTGFSGRNYGSGRHIM